MLEGTHHISKAKILHNWERNPRNTNYDLNSVNSTISLTKCAVSKLKQAEDAFK